jgi:hypothetical protein
MVRDSRNRFRQPRPSPPSQSQIVLVKCTVSRQRKKSARRRTLPVNSTPNRNALVELRQHDWPSLFVPLLRLLIRKPWVRQTQLRATFVRLEFHRYHRLGAVGRARDPGDFNEPVALQPQEPPIMRMPRSLEFSLEEESLLTSPFINTVPGAANQRSNCSVQARKSASGAVAIARSQSKRNGREERSGGAIVTGVCIFDPWLSRQHKPPQANPQRFAPAIPHRNSIVFLGRGFSRNSAAPKSARLEPLQYRFRCCDTNSGRRPATGTACTVLHVRIIHYGALWLAHCSTPRYACQAPTSASY